ncbi:uncharacterized protein LOC134207299 [Armigeres subalbatus]|uniref:uncharacterized protein LOC134207299 n=1 Tax=Armigeres subalbatus TaxID=124917 RepID=UPI002ED29012
MQKYFMDNEVDIALLQEIWIKPEERIKIKGYNFYSIRRTEGYGGVGVLLHQDLIGEEVQLGTFNPIEVIAVKIKHGFDTLTVISIYVPPNHHLKRECCQKLKQLFDAVGKIGWWSPELEEAYKAKKEILRNYNKNQTTYNYIQLQKSRAKFKRLSRAAKRKYNKEVSSMISSSTPPRQLWNIVKGVDTALSDQIKNKNYISLQLGQELMQLYFGNKWNSTLSKPPSVRTSKELEGYEMALTDAELLSVLKSRKNHSAPGPDNVSYDILKGLTPNIQEKICEMLSRVFTEEDILESWRISKIKPIPKPNANPLLATSKRPIALMNCNLKLINSAVKNRLDEITAIKGMLPQLSFGFRRNCSSTTCVNYVVNSIKEADAEGYVILATDEGDIELEINEGLPQGCPLSPLLFNLYTAELHNISTDDCQLVQYADDFALYIKGKTLEEIEDKGNDFLKKVDTQLTGLGLTINTSKCATVVFTRKAVEHLRIKVNGRKIDISNTHKYLGHTLDRTLSHRKHIQNVRTNAAQKLNIIKMLGGKLSFADREMLINIGNAVVRSRLEFGAAIYGSAAKTHLQSLQTVQNSYLRSALGLLKDTPINVLLAESGQIPMELRAEWLTKKEILKSVYHVNQLSTFVERSINADRDNGTYWTKIALKHSDLVAQVHPQDRERVFTSRRKYLELPVEARIREQLLPDQRRKDNVAPAVWIQQFKEKCAKTYDGYNQIYTDGSKTSGGTAFAVYDKSDGETIAQKLNTSYSITNAELYALKAAVELANSKNYRKVVILTDSSSACQILRNRKKWEVNFLAWEIVKKMQYLTNHIICVQWIPSHVGIEGNDLADRAAVEATRKQQDNFSALVLDDVQGLAKSEIFADWNNMYQQQSAEKGRFHYQFQRETSNRIWCKGLYLNPAEIRILSRIRSGHTLTKERLYRGGWEPSDECEHCQETENLHHLLYICPRFNTQRSKFLILELCKPLEQILEENNENDLQQIVAYLKDTKITV